MRRRGLMGEGLHKTVLLRNFDAASGQTFTESTGFTAKAGQVLTLFLDFTFASTATRAPPASTSSTAPTTWPWAIPPAGTRWSAG